MNKIFLTIFIFVMLLEGNKNIWDYRHTFSIKKDQLVEIKVVKDYKKSFPDEGTLKFRWTLFHNKRLVLLLNYEGFKKQYVLEKNYKLNTIRLNLADDYKHIDQRPFAIIKFLSFDSGTKVAKIDFLVSDRAQRFEVKIVSPKQ